MRARADEFDDGAELREHIKSEHPEKAAGLPARVLQTPAGLLALRLKAAVGRMLAAPTVLAACQEQRTVLNTAFVLAQQLTSWRLRDAPLLLAPLQLCQTIVPGMHGFSLAEGRWPGWVVPSRKCFPERSWHAGFESFVLRPAATEATV